MFVKLLSVTDDRAEAWKHSRVLQADAEINMDELEKTPFSLHSLKRYTFKVEMARVMLDLMVNFTKTMWSQSSRIIPLKDMVIDLNWANDEWSQKILDEAIKKESEENLPQDIARLYTPIMARLGWTFSMDHRTLIGFLKSLEKYQPILYSAYGLEILKAIGMNEIEFQDSPFGELVHIEEGLFDQRYHHEGLHYIEGIGEDMYNLISQFNRHAETTILNSLWITPFEKLCQMKMIDKVKYYYLINKHVYQTQILSHRACWIADWNHWSNRIAQYAKSPEDIIKLLPCHAEGRLCKYKADLIARCNGKDPNPPCPFYTGKIANLDQRELSEGKNFMTMMYRRIINDK